MFTFRKRFASRVTIGQEQGELRVLIAKSTRPGDSVTLFLFATIGFVLFSSILWETFKRNHVSGDLLVASLFAGLWLIGLFGYTACMFWCFWNALGVEELSVKNDVVRVKRTALWWKQNLEMASADISEVKAVSDWRGDSSVEFKIRGKREDFGDRILQDEANQIAMELVRAVGRHE
jgi:hypothetical protein